jgi:phosphoketolase
MAEAMCAIQEKWQEQMLMKNINTMDWNLITTASLLEQGKNLFSLNTVDLSKSTRKFGTRNGLKCVE